MGTLATRVDAATLRVPADHSSIQQAIAAATSGDIILIAPGTYYENLQLLGKQLTLRGESGAAATVVDGQQQGSVVYVDGGGTVEGLTIRNGLSIRGGGVRVEGPLRATIRYCIIESNQALPFDQGNGGGIYLTLGTAGCVVEHNVIRDNYAGDSGGGIRERGAVLPSNVIRDNVVAGNGCHVAGGGIALSAGEAIDNLVLNNWSDNFGAGIEGGGVVIRGNTIVGNYNINTFLHGAGIHVTTTVVRIANNIVAFNRGASGQNSGAGIRAPTAVFCNNSFGNDGPDYYLADTTGRQNISLDPAFCDPANSDYGISSSSPCAPSPDSSCGLVGALPVGCGTTRILPSTWGQLKVLYRD